MSAQKSQMTHWGDGIVAIDTEYFRPGLDASHLIVESGRAAFVDTGANNAVPNLLAALRANDLDPGDVDFLFLTHVHLDHAGGAGRLMQSLPNASCVVHPRGAPHMIDPGRLIAGTVAVYGKEQTRQLYGELQPIAPDSVTLPDDGQWIELNGRGLQVLFTEGHAKHHYVLHDPRSKGVFTGDSFGVSYRDFDTAAGEFIFPTTTPVHFDPIEAHRTIDRIMALAPRQLFLTHYSRVTDLVRLASDMHACLNAFVAQAEAAANDAEPLASMEKELFEYLASRLDEHHYTGSRDTLHKLIDMDMRLNAKGLQVWQQRNH